MNSFLRALRVFVVQNSFLLLFAISACAVTPTPRAKTQLTLVGADSMQTVARSLAAAFMKQRPDVAITVQRANSEIGLRAPLESPRTIGLVSREIKPSELNQTRAVTIARDGIAIVVHRDNPINAIQRAQVTQVFAGEVPLWPTGPMVGKPLVVLSREDGSGTRAAFEALAMQSKRVTRAALVFASDAAIVDYIGAHPEAIGYASMVALNEKVHALTVDDIALTQQTVESEQYPYTRPLMLVVPLETELTAQEFVDFALSGEGQRIVAERHARAAQ